MHVIFGVSGLLIFRWIYLRRVAEKIKTAPNNLRRIFLAGILLNSRLIQEFLYHPSLWIIQIHYFPYPYSFKNLFNRRVFIINTKKLRTTGRQILTLTVMECVFAFILYSCFIVFNPFFFHSIFGFSSCDNRYLGLVLASFSSTTDHQLHLLYPLIKAKGEVEFTMMVIAAFDDIRRALLFTP